MPAIDYAGGALELASVGAAVTLHPQCVFVAPERLHLGSHVIVSELTWVHAGIPLDPTPHLALKKETVQLPRA